MGFFAKLKEKLFNKKELINKPTFKKSFVTTIFYSKEIKKSIKL